MTERVQDSGDAPSGSTAPILWLCIGLTLAALIVGSLIWEDNRAGFRDAAAFAQLLAAVFGMVSVIWIAAAVLLQREELGLQRHELNLQRLEVKRLADAAEDQKKLLEAQSEIDRKNNIAANVRNILISLSTNLREFVESNIHEFIKSTDEIKDEDTITIGNIDIGRRGFVAKYKTEAGEEKQTERLAYSDFGVYLSNRSHLFAFRSLVALASVCAAVGLSDWFKGDLVFQMDPIDNAPRPDIFCVLNCAADCPDG